MQVTQEQIDRLAALYQTGETGYEPGEAGWQDDYMLLTPDSSGLDTTRDTLDMFRRASESEWSECRSMEEIDGGLFFEGVQAAKWQQRVTLAVIDCGEFRLVYQQ